MKQLFIGYKVNGKFYTVHTHLECPYLSQSMANIYFGSSKMLNKDFELAKKYVTGSYKILGRISRTKKEFRGGRLFISNVNSPDSEIDLTDKAIFPTDSTRTVALRKEYKLKSN